MSEIEILPIPDWEYGIPSKLVSYVVGEYQEDFEFLGYDHSRKTWTIYQNGDWEDCQDSVIRWHYLASMK